jgi:ATPase subunit of ABC transporter with duplicated ATPase domains
MATFKRAGRWKAANSYEARTKAVLSDSLSKNAIWKRVRPCSACGELNRLNLAKLLAVRIPTCLLLDEPTTIWTSRLCAGWRSSEGLCRARLW